MQSDACTVRRMSTGRAKKTLSTTAPPENGAPLPEFVLNLPPRTETLTAREFVEQVASANPGHRLSAVVAAIAQATKISRGTLHNHVSYGRPIRDTTAKRLAAWSGGWIDAAKTLGL